MGASDFRAECFLGEVVLGEVVLGERIDGVRVICGEGCTSMGRDMFRAKD